MMQPRDAARPAPRTFRRQPAAGPAAEARREPRAPMTVHEGGWCGVWRFRPWSGRSNRDLDQTPAFSCLEISTRPACGCWQLTHHATQDAPAAYVLRDLGIAFALSLSASCSLPPFPRIRRRRAGSVDDTTDAIRPLPASVLLNEAATRESPRIGALGGIGACGVGC